VIETGLVRELENGIDKIDRIIQQWKVKKSETKETYYEIYQTLTKFDKHIGWRYNDMKGSTYLNILAIQLADKVISIDDLHEYDQDTQDKIVIISMINEE